MTLLDLLRLVSIVFALQLRTDAQLLSDLPLLLELVSTGVGGLPGPLGVGPFASHLDGDR